MFPIHLSNPNLITVRRQVCATVSICMNIQDRENLQGKISQKLIKDTCAPEWFRVYTWE